MTAPAHYFRALEGAPTPKNTDDAMVEWLGPALADPLSPAVGLNPVEREILEAISAPCDVEGEGSDGVPSERSEGYAEVD